MSTGNWFHNLEALTEKHNWPKELDLRGTTQSPLKADLAVLRLDNFCCTKNAEWWVSLSINNLKN